MSKVLGQNIVRAVLAGVRREERGDVIETATRLAGAVSIVAGQDEAGPFGLVVSSLSVRSVKPKRVVFRVHKTASCYSRLLSAKALSLTVLGDEDQDEVAAFTARELLAPSFATDRWELEEARPPRFDGGFVSLEGEVLKRIDAGSYTTFILTVEPSCRAACKRDPLSGVIGA
jgi:flavin reductase (DIM6/NTAB) family NADH-FMN oxidoreductase RutF